MEVTIGTLDGRHPAVRSARALLRQKSPAARKACEREWVKGVRKGDRHALKKIYCAYYADLAGFAASYVESKRHGREVVHDVFLALWERRERWEVRGSLKSYLFQAVRNRALNFLRAEKSRRSLKNNVKQQARGQEYRTAEDHLCYSELSEAIKSAIEKLPPRRREAFTLHRQQGLTYKEIAGVMGITAKTVENHIGRALKALRKMLSPEFL